MKTSIRSRISLQVSLLKAKHLCVCAHVCGRGGEYIMSLIEASLAKQYLMRGVFKIWTHENIRDSPVR